MHDPLFLLTIAQSSGTGPGIVQVLIYGLFIVIFISTMIKNVIKENQKKARRKRASAGDTASEGQSLEQITARRRQQLQSRPASNSGGDASNLTMAERIARARAANQNQARSGGPLPSQKVSPRSTPAAAAGGAAAQQARAAALRQRMMQREQQRREAVAARQRQASQARATPRPAQAPPSSVSAPRRPLPPTQTPRLVAGVSPGEVRRGVADAAPQAAKPSRRHVSASVEAERAAKADRNLAGGKTEALLDFNKLTAADLRRAFILKEVLDRPLAERDPLAR